MRSASVLIGASLLASSVLGQAIAGVGKPALTSTYYDPDWEQTVVGVFYTSPFGVTDYTNTISTVISTSTTTRNRVTTTAAAAVTTTQQRVQGTAASVQTGYQFTTTYNFNGNDEVWTASVTADPSVATAIVPAGTIVNYASYQSAQDSVAYASAAASGGVAADSVANSASRTGGMITGWTTVALGGVGAVFAMLL